jgi:hypothetical protein
MGYTLATLVIFAVLVILWGFSLDVRRWLVKRRDTRHFNRDIKRLARQFAEWQQIERAWRLPAYDNWRERNGLT